LRKHRRGDLLQAAVRILDQELQASLEIEWRNGRDLERQLVRARQPMGRDRLAPRFAGLKRALPTLCRGWVGSAHLQVNLRRGAMRTAHRFKLDRSLTDLRLALQTQHRDLLLR